MRNIRRPHGQCSDEQRISWKVWFGNFPPAGGSGEGKLLKTPFSRRFRPVLVATMPAVHAPKLKPTIAPRRMRALSF